MNQGVKPNKLWHWAAIAVVIATVIHNPGGSAEFAITALDQAGSAIGWGLTRGGFDGESDYFVDPDTAQPSNTPAPVVPDQEPLPQESELSAAGGIDLRGTADQLVVEIIGLHELVEEALAPEPQGTGS